MFRLRLVCAAVLSGLSGLSVLPAVAADLTRAHVGRYEGRAPYYVVNQGPEISGPGISVTEIAFTNTDLRRSYPYIGTHDDMTQFVPATDYYGVLPAMLDHTIRPRRALHAVPRRKPARVRPLRSRH